MTDPAVLDEVVVAIDELVARHGAVHHRIAWRLGRGAIRRARRISSTTLPAIATIAQQAILARDVLADVQMLDLPAGMRMRIEQAHAACSAIVAAMSTGATDADATPLPVR